MTCITNPPYNGNLHLKILEEAMKHSDNVVNLSPIRWLTDNSKIIKSGAGLAGEKDIDYGFIKKHIEDIIIIDKDVMSRLFTSGQQADAAVQVYGKTGGFDFTIFENKLLKKLLSSYKREDSILKNLQAKGNDHCVKIPHIYGGSAKGIYISPNKEVSRSPVAVKGGSRTRWLNFDTEEEAENCRLSFETTFWRYLVLECRSNDNVVKGLPYMGNEINPRTGLKGYKSEWTDEDFYKFFDLTDDEIKIIEKYSKKF